MPCWVFFAARRHRANSNFYREKALISSGAAAATAAAPVRLIDGLISANAFHYRGCRARQKEGAASLHFRGSIHPQ